MNFNTFSSSRGIDFGTFCVGYITAASAITVGAAVGVGVGVV